jgi:hypothetical protein
MIAVTCPLSCSAVLCVLGWLVCSRITDLQAHSYQRKCGRRQFWTQASSSLFSCLGTDFTMSYRPNVDTTPSLSGTIAQRLLSRAQLR